MAAKNKGYTVYENVKGMVVCCLDCNAVYISKDGSRTCTECETWPLSYWPKLEGFFKYLGLYGLGKLNIIDSDLRKMVIENMSPAKTKKSTVKKKKIKK